MAMVGLDLWDAWGSSTTSATAWLGCPQRDTVATFLKFKASSWSNATRSTWTKPW